MCQSKIEEYVSKRGEAIWAHRRKSTGYVPSTARYEILKRAKFRCELCGVSADEKALEVDHILPRNRGSSDEDTRRTFSDKLYQTELTLKKLPQPWRCNR